MASKLCTKDFELVINPDPTFQGILWLPVFTLGAPTWAASKDRFSLTYTLGPSSSLVFHGYGGDGTAGGQITIPAVAQARNCKFHLEIAITGLNYNIVPGQSQVLLNYDQVAPYTPHQISHPWADVSTSNTFNDAFVLAAGKAYTFNIQMDHQSQVFAGGGNFLTLSWTGYVVVESYS